MKEHAQGIDSIAIAVREIETGTQEVANVSRETAETSEELSNQALHLKDNSSNLIQLVTNSDDKKTSPSHVSGKPILEKRIAKAISKRDEHFQNSRPAIKKASGSDLNIPLEHDERFEDV